MSGDNGYNSQLLQKRSKEEQQEKELDKELIEVKERKILVLVKKREGRNRQWS